MELQDLMTKVELQIMKARLSIDIADPPGCLTELAQLREFLNDQPELEAGGTCEPDEPSNGS